MIPIERYILPTSRIVIENIFLIDIVIKVLFYKDVADWMLSKGAKKSHYHS